MLKIIRVMILSLFYLLASAAFAVEISALAGSTSKRWSSIAQETQSFIGPAGAILRYGTREKYFTMKMLSAGTVNCNNETFGDPIRYTYKSCYVEKLSSEFKLIGPANKIANEYSAFYAVPGSVIRYGAGHSWKTRVVGLNGVCDNNYFGGDPAPSIVKSCYEDSGDKPSQMALLTPYNDAFNRNGVSLVQLNVAGPGFSPQELPGKEGTNYVFPDANYLDKWQINGIRIIRLSILWERLQPVQNQSFDIHYADKIDYFLAQAAKRDMSVIIDIHNYGRYYNKIIGTPEMPTSAYSNLMQRVAQRWGSDKGIHGYDLMNEPYGEADKYWKANAQAGIDAIRLYDRTHPIYVEGRTWSNTANFPDLNADLLLLNDSSDNLIFSAHLYLDDDTSGQYFNKINETFDPMIGVNRAKPFVEWVIRNKKRGHIGEFGVPGDDPRWLMGMDNLLAYLHENCVPLAYWAAGPWWGSYPLSVEPSNGVMPPQWSVLEKWIKATDKKCS